MRDKYGPKSEHARCVNKPSPEYEQQHHGNAGYNLGVYHWYVRHGKRDRLYQRFRILSMPTAAAVPITVATSDDITASISVFLMR